MANNTFEETRLMDEFSEEAFYFDEAISLAQKYNHESLKNLKDYEEINETYIESFKEKIVMNRIFSLIGEGAIIFSAGVISILNPLVAGLVFGVGSIKFLVSHIKKTSKLKKCLKKAYEYQTRFDGYSAHMQMNENYLKDKNKIISWVYLEIIRRLNKLDLETQKEYYNRLSKILKNAKDNLDELYQELGLFKDKLFEASASVKPVYQYDNSNAIDNMLSHLEIMESIDENIFNHIHYLIFNLSRDLRPAYILKLGEIVVNKLSNDKEIFLTPRMKQYALAYLSEILKDDQEYKDAYTSMYLDQLIMFAIDLNNRKLIR